MRRFIMFVLSAILITCCFCSCQKKSPVTHEEQVMWVNYTDVRLGDGVPLALQLAVYWQPEDTDAGPARPNTLLGPLLQARGVEVARRISNTFPQVDSVFSSQREAYVDAIKESLLLELPEPDLTVRDVIVQNVEFPVAFTTALEEIGLQKLKQEQISKQNQLDIARAAAQEKKAEADGQVAIAQAEAEGRLQAIQARTEASRRKSEMARAETAAAVARTQASAEANRLRQLKNVEVEKQRELEMIAVDKQRELDKVALEQQLELARLCQENPTYASFLVNRELAGNVEIAVLPTGTDTNVFGGLLQSRLPGKTNN
ncbi:MAG: SPFH domain-containing protein [Bacteroidota bacterium]